MSEEKEVSEGRVREERVRRRECGRRGERRIGEMDTGDVDAEVGTCTYLCRNENEVDNVPNKEESNSAELEQSCVGEH